MTDLYEQLRADIPNLPSLFPQDTRYVGVKQIPPYLVGKTGTFHRNGSSAVQNIGECFAVMKHDPTNRLGFCDSEGRWWDIFIPHTERNKV